jgi:hypothetical protein
MSALATEDGADAPDDRDLAHAQILDQGITIRRVVSFRELK